ncbi:MAG: hypothetical protein M1820_006986 [Bogoriella megaspora]|nr:MAG: hypothetical protein M1820_006986 [Bogoriella megaspora]
MTLYPVSLFVDPSSGRCGLQDTPSGAIFASVPAQFFDPPDEAPCDEPLNVTNPNTGKQITAIVVGQFTDASGQDLQLSSEGLAALAPDANPNHAPGVVIWTFA